jgi:CheY-like chemotaxis protein
LIERVLVNLLENASKYTPAGSQVILSAEAAGEELTVSVSDNGPGLPVGREEAVFQKFTRGDRESATPGVGLGLAICRAIVEAHHGKIVGTNRAGGGVTFSLSRCRWAVHPVAESRRSVMAEPLPVAILVEDERQIRRFVRTALEAEGWSVVETETLRQGLTDAGTRKPDLIILDLGLPDGDGMDFMRDVRGWSQVPIIVLSARVGEQDKIEALDAGADDYLIKPFGVGELLARVRAASRRLQLAGAAQGAHFQFGDVAVDMSLRTVHKGAAAVHSDAHRVPVARPAHRQRGKGVDASADSARGVGSFACGRWALRAGVHGASAS